MTPSTSSVPNYQSRSFNKLSQVSGRKPPPALVNTPPDEDKRNTSHKSACIICSHTHALYRCHVFLSKSPKERLNFVKQHNLCTNCLQSPHAIRNCKSSSRCRVCNYPYHTLLHLNKNSESVSRIPDSPPSDNSLNVNSGSKLFLENPPAGPSQTAGSSTQAYQCSNFNIPSNKHNTVLLSTVVIHIRDTQGNFHIIRALIDTAGMANFISERFANRLNVKRQRIASSIEGVNGQVSHSNNGITLCHIKPILRTKPTFTVQAIILPKVCSNQPNVLVDSQGWTHIKDLPFISPDETKCEDIYNQLVYREPSERFVVPLPFKHALPTLGDS